MEFYPHNIDVTIIGNAVSSSQALTGSFINNSSVISATVVDLAGLALNISGSRGTDGANYTSFGPEGSQGDRGVTGFRGDSIFLLSSAWSGSACGSPGAVCNEIGILYNAGPGFDECNVTQGSATYYTTSSVGIITNNTVGVADGAILYTDSVCTQVAGNRYIHNSAGVIFYTDGAGVISTTGCAS
jgi:hypothetical protein